MLPRSRRVVAYFTSRGLSIAAQGLTALLQGGGRLLLVASPLFDADDVGATQKQSAVQPVLDV